jgi:hypothetical protein
VAHLSSLSLRQWWPRWVRGGIWSEVEGRVAPNVDPVEAARAATAQDPARAASVETDEGGGPVVVIAIGSGDVHYGPAWNTDYEASRLFLRIWEVEEAGDEVGAVDLPELLLSEFREALLEQEIEGVRLLTAEESLPDGRAVIVEASWYDSEFETQQREEWSSEFGPGGENTST